MNFFRKTALFLLVLSVLAACGSFVSQYVLGMNPCVLCIVQRLCVLAVGVAALLVVFFRQSSKVGRTFSALLISAPAVYGIGTAAYQLWLQSLPPGTAPSCGAPWTFRLKDWPLFDWFEPIVRGFGNCAVPDYFLGIALPVWSIAYFYFVVVLVWFAWLKTK